MKQIPFGLIAVLVMALSLVIDIFILELEQNQMCRACEETNWTGVVECDCTRFVCDGCVAECGKLKAYGICGTG